MEGACGAVRIFAVLRGDKPDLALFRRVFTLKFSQELFDNLGQRTTLVRDMLTETLVGVL
jgi:hypothetical protein